MNVDIISKQVEIGIQPENSVFDKTEGIVQHPDKTILALKNSLELARPTQGRKTPLLLIRKTNKVTEHIGRIAQRRRRYVEINRLVQLPN